MRAALLALSLSASPALAAAPCGGDFATWLREVKAEVVAKGHGGAQTDRIFNEYRQEAVRRVIARFAGVRNATVLIDGTSERRINGASVEPAASESTRATLPSRTRQPRHAWDMRQAYAKNHR